MEVVYKNILFNSNQKGKETFLKLINELEKKVKLQKENQTFYLTTKT